MDININVQANVELYTCILWVVFKAIMASAIRMSVNCFKLALLKVLKKFK